MSSSKHSHGVLIALICALAAWFCISQGEYRVSTLLVCLAVISYTVLSTIDYCATKFAPPKSVDLLELERLELQDTENTRRIHQLERKEKDFESEIEQYRLAIKRLVKENDELSPQANLANGLTQKLDHCAAQTLDHNREMEFLQRELADVKRESTKKYRAIQGLRSTEHILRKLLEKQRVNPTRTLEDLVAEMADSNSLRQQIQSLTAEVTRLNQQIAAAPQQPSFLPAPPTQKVLQPSEADNGRVLGNIMAQWATTMKQQDPSFSEQGKHPEDLLSFLKNDMPLAAKRFREVEQTSIKLETTYRAALDITQQSYLAVAGVAPLQEVLVGPWIQRLTQDLLGARQAASASSSSNQQASAADDSAAPSLSAPAPAPTVAAPLFPPNPFAHFLSAPTASSSSPSSSSTSVAQEYRKRTRAMD